MLKFEYQLIKVCSRAGKEYYHVLPTDRINFLLQNFKNLNIRISHPEYLVISLPDCFVTVFTSGRMLIENLPINSESRAREIVEQIIRQSHP